jgi:phosphopentomutase
MELHDPHVEKTTGRSRMNVGMQPSITRVIVIVMDSVGCGELPDASLYGDEGSDTLGHIADEVELQVPTLRSLGLDRVARINDGASAAVPRYAATPRGAFGRMAEASPGKDSVTGHWEIGGIILDRPFPTFPHGFSADIIAEFERRIGRTSIGNIVASGTQIIDALGPEHMRTGFPIVYTSADSVFQIAAHEGVVPIAELYRYCEVAFDLVGRGLGIGRVIARPFVGEPGAFTRTSNRHDYALQPFHDTVLDVLKAAGHPVVAIGKIEDLFAARGMTKAIHTTSDDHGMDMVMQELDATDRGLIFVNLVDFDAKYGHRNDVPGYAANLERFDTRLAQLLPALRETDLLVVTADHGNDPGTPSTDHSREYVPVLLFGASVAAGLDLGTRKTFADLGQTVAHIFGVGPLLHGVSLL